jgi:hypothetical protein
MSGTLEELDDSVCFVGREIQSVVRELRVMNAIRILSIDPHEERIENWDKWMETRNEARKIVHVWASLEEE